MKNGKGLITAAIVGLGLWAWSRGRVAAAPAIPPAIPPVIPPAIPPVKPSADVQVAAVLGSQPTASVRELDIVEQIYGRESEAYQATIDIAFEAAQAEAEATGGVVSWSSDGGYAAISHEEADSYGYYDY